MGRENEQALLNAVAGHYHATMLSSPDALQNLRWRGEVGGDLLRYFFVGYSNRTLVHELELRGQATLKDLQAIGVVKKSGIELFKGAVVIPVLDAQRNVVQMCGAHHVSSGHNTPDAFLPGRARGLFHPQAFAMSEELILTSSVLDVLRFWYAGHTNATASGAGLSITDEHLEAMKRHGTKRVLIAFEKDPWSERAALEVAETLVRAEIAPYRAVVSIRYKPTSKKWTELVKKAVPMLGSPPRPELPALDVTWQRDQVRGDR